MSLWTSPQFGSADIVGCIEAAFEGSEVRRSRKQILNQIVRQGLVSDRKSLHKKAPKKKVVSNGTWNKNSSQNISLLKVKINYNYVYFYSKYFSNAIIAMRVLLAIG